MEKPPAVEMGTIAKVADLDPRPASPLLKAQAELLPTGLRVVDAVVPIRKGGTLDFLGPVGTGHLVLISEIARNLSAQGPVVVIAVASMADNPDTSSSRLPRLIDPDGIPELCIVVDATDDPAQAARAAGGHAARLASEGTTVLLCIDRVTSDNISPALLSELAGVADRGSVTVVRFVPHARNAEPTEPWPLDTTITLSLERMSAGVLPAVDVLASRSSLVEDNELEPDAIGIAAAVRSALAAAARIDHVLAQPLHVAEPYTGTPGQTTSPSEARGELKAAVANM